MDADQRLILFLTGICVVISLAVLVRIFNDLGYELPLIVAMIAMGILGLAIKVKSMR
jgi:hypothetical protein